MSHPSDGRMTDSRSDSNSNSRHFEHAKFQVLRSARYFEWTQVWKCARGARAYVLREKQYQRKSRYVRRQSARVRSSRN